MRQLSGFAMSPRSNGDPTPDPVPRAGQSAPPGGLGGGGISRQPQAHQRMAYAAASRVRCAGLRPPWTRRRAAIIEPRRHTGGWVCDTEPDFDGRLFTAMSRRSTWLPKAVLLCASLAPTSQCDSSLEALLLSGFLQANVCVRR